MKRLFQPIFSIKRTYIPYQNLSGKFHNYHSKVLSRLTKNDSANLHFINWGKIIVGIAIATSLQHILHANEPKPEKEATTEELNTTKIDSTVILPISSGSSSAVAGHVNLTEKEKVNYLKETLKKLEELRELSDFLGMVSILGEALAIFPKDSMLKLYQLHSMIALGNFDDAKTLFMEEFKSPKYSPKTAEEMYELAQIHMKLDEDSQYSVCLIEKAGRRGYLPGLFAHAAWMITGEHGVPKDPQKGIDLLMKYIASEELQKDRQPIGVDSMARFYLADALLKTGNIGEALNLLKTNVDKGNHIPSMTLLGMFYAEPNKQHREYRDIEKAIELLKKASDAGDIKATFCLGEIQMLHLNDIPSAFSNMQMAYDHGEVKASSYLSFFYQTGLGGIEPNSIKAMQFIKSGVMRDDPKATLMWGMNQMQSGEYQQGRKLFEKCYWKGNKDCMFLYGLSIQFGLGGYRSVDEGNAFMVEALNSGESGMAIDYAMGLKETGKAIQEHLLPWNKS